MRLPQMWADAEKSMKYADNREVNNALNIANKLIIEHPKFFISYYARAYAYFNREGIISDTLISDLKMCISLNNKFSPAYGMLAEFIEANHPEEALEYINKAITYCDDKRYLSDYYCDRSRIKTDLLDWAGAIKDATFCLNSDPTNWNALLYRGQSYLKQQQFYLAMADLDKSIGLYPGDAFAYYYRGLVKVKNGNKEGGCEDFDRAKLLIKTGQFDETINQYCK